MTVEQEITRQLSSEPFSKHLKKHFSSDKISAIESLKKTDRSQIWKLTINHQSLILKIYTSPTKHKNSVELNVFKNNAILSDFMPEIYCLEEKVNKDETWVLMEFIPQIRGQVIMKPAYFDYIIPTVAKLHATTSKHLELKNIVPVNTSIEKRKERHEYRDITKEYLTKALKKKDLYEMIEPHYKIAMELLNNFSPTFETECVIHGDMHMQNICCSDITKSEWDIKFIDWETARFASGWTDLAVLVEILMNFRKDWQKDSEEIRNHCVSLYAENLRKNGMTIKEDPMKLYKMAYLERTIEKGLYNHLRRVLEGREGKLLGIYLEHIGLWGKDFLH